MPKVFINIVTWNNLSYLPDCLESIKKQTFRDYSILIIDNNSQDGTVDFLKKNYPDIELIINHQNLGYSQAHNQGVGKANSEYILCMNPDIILTPDFLEKLVQEANHHPQFGSLAGKLLRLTHGLKKDENLVKIDATGLKIFRSRRGVNRGEGEIDQGQYNRKEEVFGHSGALVLYQKKSLEDVKIFGEYFDEDFFAYKEDVDIATRLRLSGWPSLYVPKAQAYHQRAIASDLSRNKRSGFINYLSYKNHLLWLVKNEFLSNFLRDFIFIFWYELRKLIYLLLFEPSTLKSIIKFFQQLPKALKKRKEIIKKRKVTASEIRKWFE